MKVLLASSEAIPYAKTGGLADVAGSLFSELRRSRIDARLVLPLYRGAKDFNPEDTGIKLKIPLGGRKHTGRVFLHGKHVILIECDKFYDREDLYGTALGEYEDNAQRFIFFARALLEAAEAIGFRPDIVHCNDWHTGLVPLYMKSAYRDYYSGSASLFSIHNLGYQGIFPPSALPLTGFGMELFTPEKLEFYGKMNFMKAGIISADALSTVSVNYSKEILLEEHGFRLDGIIKTRAKNLYGIVNGIDYKEWNPAGDSHIAAAFTRENLSGKKKCKRMLAKEGSLKKADAPLLAMVGRLSAQKGIDILIEAAESVLDAGANLAILGKGEENFEADLKALARKHAGKVFCTIGFDEELAHRIYAGSDMLLMPSRYEPCGLTQMIAMRYGTVPVARATGGIVDTVEDCVPYRGKGTGFLFRDYSPSALYECVLRALCIHSDKDKWNALVGRCMKVDFSWKASCRKYIALYNKLIKKSQ